MKKILLIIFSVFTLSSTGFGQIKKFQDLLGRWEIVGEDMPGASLEVIDSTQIFLTYQDEKKQVIDYTLDLTKSPAVFDFSLADSSGKIKVYSIIQIFGNGVMKWQLFLDEDRSYYFTASRGELMYLKKTKPVSAAVVKAQ